MSYILDALRRAEADRERERGRVPGLNTPTLAGQDGPPADGSRGWLPWAAAALVLVVGIGTGVWWAGGRHEAAAPMAPAASAPIAVPGAPTAPAAPAPIAVPPMTAPSAAAPGPQTAEVPAAHPAAPLSPYLPPLPPPRPVAEASSPAAVAARPAPATQPASAAPTAEARIPTFSELPEALQRELPKLQIGGTVYSDDPATRFVMIRGEVLHEGASIGTDLVLEQIRPRELVLRYKGQRYRQPL